MIKENKRKSIERVCALVVIGMFMVISPVSVYAGDPNDWTFGGNDMTVPGESALGTTSTHDLPIITDDTERMRITSGGNIGIGDTSPDFKLEVTGSSGDGYFGVSSTDNNNDNGDIFIIDDEGKVGIGTDDPGSALEIKTGHYTSATSALHVKNSLDTSLLFVRDDGNVGIGVTNPKEKLEINGNILFNIGSDRSIYVEQPSTSHDGYSLTVQAGTAWSQYGPNNFVGGNLYLRGGDAWGMGELANGGDVYIYGGAGAIGSYDGDVIIAHTGSATRGRVGIGTTSPSSKLEVIGNVELGNLFDNDGSNFFDGVGDPSKTVIGITSTGTLQTTDISISETQVTGEIESVIAGDGLTGGGQSDEVILHVNDGDGIDIISDEVRVDVTDLLGPGLREDDNNIGVYGLMAADGNPTNVVYVDNDGDVGIGESDPKQKIVVSDGKVGIGFNSNTQTAALAVNGYVGIGSIHPQYDLDIGDGSCSRTLRIYGVPTSKAIIGWLDISSSFGTGDISITNTYPGSTPGYGDIIISPAGVGNVGIGMTNPQAKLHLQVDDSSTVGSSEIARFTRLDGLERGVMIYSSDDTDSGVGLRVYNTASDFFIADKDGTRNFIIEDNGNVGIGVEEPNAPLHARLNSGTSEDKQLIADFENHGSIKSTHILLYGKGNGGEANWINTEGDECLILGDGNNPDTLTISGGNVGIDVTNPISGKLQIDSASEETALYINNPLDVTTDNGAINVGGGLFIDNNEIQTTSDLYLNADTSYAVIICAGGGDVGIGGAVNPEYSVTIHGPIYIPADVKCTGELKVDQKMGIGTLAADDIDGLLDLQTTGTLKGNYDFLHITNGQYGSDMDGTETSIRFNQFYNDPLNEDEAIAGRITVGTETDWTTTASTQDSYMAFGTVLNSVYSERMRINSDGNVGIGYTDPKVKLAVNGNVAIGTSDTSGRRFKVYGDSHFDGNVEVDGTFECMGESINDLVVSVIVESIKKWFVIDHPIMENKSLVHACLEGPENGVFYRGNGTLVNGTATVYLPYYYNALTMNNTYTVLLTAKGSTPFTLSYDSFNETAFKVYGSVDDGEFDWEVKAIRADIDPLEVERDKETQ